MSDCEAMLATRDEEWEDARSRGLLALLTQARIRDAGRGSWEIVNKDGETKATGLSLSEALDIAVTYPVSGRLAYDDEAGGHICTGHGATMRVVRDVQPTESGSWYYACRVLGCAAAGWSGA